MNKQIKPATETDTLEERLAKERKVCDLPSITSNDPKLREIELIDLRVAKPCGRLYNLGEVPYCNKTATCKHYKERGCSSQNAAASKTPGDNKLDDNIMYG